MFRGPRLCRLFDEGEEDLWRSIQCFGGKTGMETSTFKCIVSSGRERTIPSWRESKGIYGLEAEDGQVLAGE
jgi:hypothetical protein